MMLRPWVQFRADSFSSRFFDPVGTGLLFYRR
jgi:hypothetical protein